MMDYETKLILQDLIEAIEKPDGPDWWMIVLTVINIVAFVFVAWTQIKIQKHQIKLQEQQTKAQEYAVYKQLYSMIYEADFLINNFLFSLFAAVIDRPNIDLIKNSIAEDYKRYHNAERQLMQHIVDFKLKMPNGEQYMREYQSALIQMASITLLLDRILHDPKGLQMNPSEEEKKYRPTVIIKDREVQKKILISRIVNKEDSEWLDWLITEFLTKQAEIEKLEFAEQIAKRCKID